MKIGLISDTHGYLDPKVPQLFEGVDYILHGGDVGTYAILNALESIAPLTAVLGNTDGDIGIRETEVLSLENRVFLIQHIVEMARPTDEFQRRLSRVKPEVVVFGHTHKPLEERRDGILYINPGYAGRKRFDLPRSVALLQVSDEGLSLEFLPL